MRFVIFFILLGSINVAFGQFATQKEKDKYRTLEPSMWMSILDRKNSDPTLKFNSMEYENIPSDLDFRGTVVEAISWTDAQGEKILLQTVSGYFDKRVYSADSIGFTIHDKSELNAYLFEKRKNATEYTKIWKMYDYNECFEGSWYTGFIPKATTITDLDKDGIAEITMPYVLFCRNGSEPATMKIMMMEGNVKYALRGLTMPSCMGQSFEGGNFTPSDNLENELKFKMFLQKRWDAHKCENKRFE